MGWRRRPAFIGMSKGGVNEFNWGVVNPDKVACIYADNPGVYEEDFAKIPELAKHDVPILEVGGTEDGLLRPNALAVEDIYHQAGGLITVIIKEGTAHHPHSLAESQADCRLDRAAYDTVHGQPARFRGCELHEEVLLQPRAFLHLPEGRKHLCHGPGARVHGLLRTLRRSSRQRLQVGQHVDHCAQDRGAGKTLGPHGGCYREGFDRRAGAAGEGLPHCDRPPWSEGGGTIPTNSLWIMDSRASRC